MLYRPLTRNEYAAAQQLDALGFFYPYDAMGIEEELEEPEDPPELKSLWGALMIGVIWPPSSPSRPAR